MQENKSGCFFLNTVYIRVVLYVTSRWRCRCWVV